MAYNSTTDLLLALVECDFHAEKRTQQIFGDGETLSDEESAIAWNRHLSHNEKVARLNELRILRKFQDRISDSTAFGDDNQSGIRAQIRVINAGLTMEQVIDEFGDESAYTLSAALNASEWLHHGASAPSEDWKLLIAA